MWAVFRSGQIYPVVDREDMTRQEAHNVAEVMATQDQTSYEIAEYDPEMGVYVGTEIVHPGVPWWEIPNANDYGYT